MKKTILGIATLAFALSSCTKEAVVVDSAPQAIIFGEAAVGNNTRAKTENPGEIKSQFEEGDQFGVFAYYTGTEDYTPGVSAPNFMYNQAITRTATANVWSYSPLKYWPNDVTSDNEAGKVSFFAYWPMANPSNGISVITQNDDELDPVISYNMDNQYDLMWGVSAADNQPHLNLTKQATDDKINFLFKHALSRVGFEVKLGGDIIADAMSDASTTVTINSIEFGGTLDGTDVENDLAPALVKSGQLNLNNEGQETAKWVNGSDKYLIKLTTEDFTEGGTFKKVAVDGTNAAFTETITNIGASYSMVIPSDLSSSNAKMRIIYTVQTADGNLDGGFSTIENKTVVDLGTTFASGTAYLYSFTIGLNTVKVTETIEEWGDPSSTSVTVPNP